MPKFSYRESVHWPRAEFPTFLPRPQRVGEIRPYPLDISHPAREMNNADFTRPRSDPSRNICRSRFPAIPKRRCRNSLGITRRLGCVGACARWPACVCVRAGNGARDVTGAAIVCKWVSGERCENRAATPFLYFVD